MGHDPALSGRLRDERLPRILTYLQRHKKTGALVVRRNDQQKSIFIKAGDIIFAASKYQDDWLGEVLLKLGKISLKQYAAASDITRKTQKRFGAVLVEQGTLTPKDLFWAVSHQVKEIILSIFTWVDGEYAFEEGPLPAEEVITLKMSTANLILDGIRRINDFTRLRGELPPLDTVLQITTDPLILFQDIKLTDAERKVLSQIDGVSTLSQVFESSGLPAFDTLKLLYYFLSIGLAEAGVSKPATEFQPQEPPAFRSEAAQKAPAETPPVSPSKTPEEIAEELIQEVKQEQREAVRETVRESPEEIFRKEGEATGAIKQKIQEAYEALSHQDFYEVLGVSREATRDEIKRAYFRLAKEYHPDRHFQTGLEQLTSHLEALFRKITEAYDTLLMERKRKEYDAELAQKKIDRGRTAAGPASSPIDPVEQGEAALKKGDPKAAAYYFEAAVKASPGIGRYHALLAKALAQLSGRQRDAETHFKKAIGLEPSAVEHYIGLGMLYKKSGMTQRAQRQFEEALLWDPNNETATAELKKLKA